MSTHPHVFDPLSGWCSVHRCLTRDDGRMLTNGGDEFRAGTTYTHSELQDIRNRNDIIVAHRYTR